MIFIKLCLSKSPFNKLHSNISSCELQKDRKAFQHSQTLNVFFLDLFPLLSVGLQLHRNPELENDKTSFLTRAQPMNNELRTALRNEVPA